MILMKTNFSYMICQIKGTSNNYQLIHLKMKLEKNTEN